MRYLHLRFLTVYIVQFGSRAKNCEKQRKFFVSNYLSARWKGDGNGRSRKINK